MSSRVYPDDPVHVCSRCSALVDPHPDEIAVHTRWHERIDAVLATVEYTEGLARELRERGDDG